MHIDSEVIFLNGAAVNWRELWHARRNADETLVLVKTMAGVRLLDIASLSGVGWHP